MKSLKNRVFASVGAAAVVLSLSASSFASYSAPDYGDVTYAISNITVEITKIVALVNIDYTKVKVVDISDILNGSQVVTVENSLNNLGYQINVVTLKSVLNTVQVLNGANILNIGDVLSNNNVNIGDVQAANLFDDGSLLIITDKLHHH